MRRTPVVLVLLLALTLADPPAARTQVETPVPEPPATPLATPQSAPPQDLAGVAPRPLTGQVRAEFEAYVAAKLAEFGVPGASVAVVRGGEVAYAQGFGVKELGGTAPVGPDTLMMIGSVTKSLTSTMAATVVDDGWLSWDAPVAELLPGFAVADSQLVPRVSVADAFCACTGLPRRDLEVMFNADALTPDRLIAQIAELPLTAPLGEKFQYSNQMYAAGGYAAVVAAGASPADLYGGYVAAMRERLLNPMGMDRSTFALAVVLTSGDYALPHATDLDGRTRPVPLLVDDRFVSSVAPAGALWSSARDMARYVQTELADGVAPDGTRVVSAENLARTRAPRVAVPPPPGVPPVLAESAGHYAMGWLVGAYHGSPLIHHSGGTLGFASQAAFLPEANLGVAILTNGAGAALFNLAIQHRLFELLFDRAPEFDALAGQVHAASGARADQLRARLRPVDPATIAPYLGRYASPALGEVDLALRGGRLVFDAGEVRSELRPVADEAGQVAAYVFADPPLAGPTPVTLRQGADGRPEMVATVEDEGVVTYVFALLEPAAAATPAP